MGAYDVAHRVGGNRAQACVLGSHVKPSDWNFRCHLRAS